MGRGETAKSLAMHVGRQRRSWSRSRSASTGSKRRRAFSLGVWSCSRHNEAIRLYFYFRHAVYRAIPSPSRSRATALPCAAASIRRAPRAYRPVDCPEECNALLRNPMTLHTRHCLIRRTYYWQVICHCGRVFTVAQVARKTLPKEDPKFPKILYIRNLQLARCSGSIHNSHATEIIIRAHTYQMKFSPILWLSP